MKTSAQFRPDYSVINGQKLPIYLSAFPALPAENELNQYFYRSVFSHTSIQTFTQVQNVKTAATAAKTTKWNTLKIFDRPSARHCRDAFGTA